MLSPLLFAIVVDVITEKIKRVVVNELLYADDLVLRSKTIKDLKERFWNWKDVLESKGLKGNPRNTKVMVSGSEGELFKSKINPCGVCGRRIMVNSVLCTKFKSWVQKFEENAENTRTSYDDLGSEKVKICNAHASATS